MNKAIFLDKDGTLITDVPYNVDPEKIRLEDKVADALIKFQQNGYLLIVISNQSGVGLGYFTEDDLQKAHNVLYRLLIQQAVRLDGIYYCPHHPESQLLNFKMECDCRKPLPGLIQRAAADFYIDLSESWMIGDILDDVEAGNKAGCKTVLLMNGHETEWELNEWREPSHKAKDMEEAAAMILASDKELRYDKLERV